MKKFHFLFGILSLNINAYVDIKGSRYRYILSLAVHLSGGLRERRIVDSQL